MLTLLRLSAAMVELCHDFIFLENDRLLAGQSAPSPFQFKNFDIFLIFAQNILLIHSKNYTKIAAL